MILYTFRTNKNSGQFLELADLNFSSSIFVIQRPSRDIPILLSLISDQRPEWVIGFASAGHGRSRWEQFAINRFGRGRVSQNLTQDAKLKLSKPNFLGVLSDISRGQGMSAGFCNQAAFKIEEYIKLNQLEAKSGFLHLNI